MIRPEKSTDTELIFSDDEDADTPSTATLGDDDNTSTIQYRLVEPAMLLFFTAVTLSETAIPNIVELHYCRSSLNVSDSICLDTTSIYENKIQTFTSYYQIIRSVIESLFPALASFCIGPWSDIFGRKPLLLSSLFGYSICYCLLTLQTTFPNLQPLFFLLSSIPIPFTGGSTIFIMASFCYVCDVTTIQTRAVRLGILQSTIFLGNLFGALLCPWIVSYNYTAVFGTSAALCYSILFYVYFFIEESVIPNQALVATRSNNPLSLEHARDMFDACLTKFSPVVRWSVLLLMMALPLSLIVMIGEGSINYLFVQDVLGMDLKQYTILTAFSVIVTVIGTFGGLWLFSKKYQIHDVYFLCLATFLRLLGDLVMMFSFHTWHIYLAKVFSCFSGVVDPLIRSFFSKIVSHDQLGKVFSLMAASGALTPLISTLIYNSVYDMTLSSFPAGVYMLSSFLLLLMLYLLVLTAILHVQPKQNQQTGSVSKEDQYSVAAASQINVQYLS